MFFWLKNFKLILIGYFVLLSASYLLRTRQEFVQLCYFDLVDCLQFYLFSWVARFDFQVVVLDKSNFFLRMDFYFYFFSCLQSNLIFLYNFFLKIFFLVFDYLFVFEVFKVDFLKIFNEVIILSLQVGFTLFFQVVFFIGCSLFVFFFFFFKLLSGGFHCLEYFVIPSILYFVGFCSFWGFFFAWNNYQKFLSSKFFFFFFLLNSNLFFWFFFIVSFFIFLDLNFFFFSNFENLQFLLNAHFYYYWFNLVWLYSEYYWISFFFLVFFPVFPLVLKQWFSLCILLNRFIVLNLKQRFAPLSIFVFSGRQLFDYDLNIFFVFWLQLGGRWLKYRFFNRIVRFWDDFSLYFIRMPFFPLEVSYGIYIKPYFWIFPEMVFFIPIFKNWSFEIEWVPLSIRVPGLTRNILIYNPFFVKEFYFEEVVYFYSFFSTEWSWRFQYYWSRFGIYSVGIWNWFVFFFCSRLIFSVVWLVPLFIQEVFVFIEGWFNIYFEFVLIIHNRYYRKLEFLYYKVCQEMDLLSFFFERNRYYEKKLVKKHQFYICRNQRYFSYEDKQLIGSDAFVNDELKLWWHQPYVLMPEQYGGYFQGVQGILYDEILFEDEYSIWEIICDQIELMVDAYEEYFGSSMSYRMGSRSVWFDAVIREVIVDPKRVVLLFDYEKEYSRWYLRFFRGRRATWDYKMERMASTRENEAFLSEVAFSLQDMFGFFFEDFIDDMEGLSLSFMCFFQQYLGVGRTWNVFFFVEHYWYYLAMVVLIIWGWFIYNLWFFVVFILTKFVSPFLFWFLIWLVFSFLRFFYKFFLKFFYVTFRFCYSFFLAKKLIIRDLFLKFEEMTVSEEELLARKDWTPEEWFAFWNEEEKRECVVLEESFEFWVKFWNLVFFYFFCIKVFLFRKKKKYGTVGCFLFFFKNLVLEFFYWLVWQLKNF